jgi:signal transduction histidine kinase
MTNKKPLILAIDDTPVNLKILSMAIEPDFDFLTATSGDMGLKIAAKELPDLILLDIVMEEMDGFETCRRLKANLVLKDIPVVFVTALNEVKSEIEGLALGAADYITKPIHLGIARQRIRNLVERERLRRQVETNNAELMLLNAKLAQFQGHLLQSEKMAAVGQLAAGVAHEINTPIGFVKSNLATLNTYMESLLTLIEVYERCSSARSLQDEATLQAAIDKADLAFLREDAPVLLLESHDGLERVKKIILDLRGFSCLNNAQWQVSDLTVGLESTLNVATNQLKDKVEIIKNYGQLPLVRCYLAEINQVFLNLLNNAAHAIEERGKITLSSGVDGAWIWVSVEDTGQGMPPEVQKRIFEPFFTTKPVGKGTGLGLSLCYDIVKKHGGRIEVSSEPGCGSKFQIWLPVHGPDDLMAC